MTEPLRFRRVLVGADGSDAAADALVLARRLVEPDGELVLAVIRERGFRRHRAVHAPAPEPGERIAEHSASSAARGLAELAQAEQADLIVLGAHGGFDRRTSPGPTALRLLHGGPCAIAVAPLGAREAEPVRHVGVAYDGSPQAAAALASAYALAERTGAAMSIFSTWVSSGPGIGSFDPDVVSGVLQLRRSEIQDRLDAAAETAPAGVNPRTVMLHGDAAVEIARACDGVVDVLFAGSRGYGPVHRTLAGSVSEALMLASTQPVVILPRACAPVTPA